jgi:uncharacterized membrane protein YdbT with pleckstrin-like domain
MDALVYRCPFCRSTVEVASERVDETVLCPNPECGRPFELRAPPGEVVENTSRAEHVTGEAEAEYEMTETDADDINEEERLAYENPAMFRNHPLSFLFQVAVMIGGFGGALWFWYRDRDILAVAAAVLGAVALCFFLVWKLQMMFTRLTITTKRTILRKGIIARRTNEVRHNDVRNLRVDQNTVQRILGVGTISISSAGQDGIEIVAKGFADPDGLISIIRKRQAA